MSRENEVAEKWARLASKRRVDQAMAELSSVLKGGAGHLQRDAEVFRAARECALMRRRELARNSTIPAHLIEAELAGVIMVLVRLAVERTPKEI